MSSHISFDLSGKTAIVTGASRGIGQAIALGLAGAGADVAMLSSLSEGLSVTLLEAASAELPIAATDVGGNREIVIHNETGLLSERGDARGLADNLIAMLGDGDETCVGDAALRRARPIAGDEEPEVVGEIDPADQIAAQIVASHRDTDRVGRRDRRQRLILLADTQTVSFRYAKIVSYVEIYSDPRLRVK